MWSLLVVFGGAVFDPDLFYTELHLGSDPANVTNVSLPLVWRGRLLVFGNGTIQAEWGGSLELMDLHVMGGEVRAKDLTVHGSLVLFGGKLLATEGSNITMTKGIKIIIEPLDDHFPFLDLGHIGRSYSFVPDSFTVFPGVLDLRKAKQKASILLLGGLTPSTCAKWLARGNVIPNWTFGLQCASIGSRSAQSELRLAWQFNSSALHGEYLDLGNDVSALKELNSNVSSLTVFGNATVVGKNGSVSLKRLKIRHDAYVIAKDLRVRNSLCVDGTLVTTTAAVRNTTSVTMTMEQGRVAFLNLTGKRGAVPLNLTICVHSGYGYSLVSYVSSLPQTLISFEGHEDCVNWNKKAILRGFDDIYDLVKLYCQPLPSGSALVLNASDGIDWRIQSVLSRPEINLTSETIIGRPYASASYAVSGVGRIRGRRFGVLNFSELIIRREAKVSAVNLVIDGYRHEHGTVGGVLHISGGVLDVNILNFGVDTTVEMVARRGIVPHLSLSGVRKAVPARVIIDMSDFDFSGWNNVSQYSLIAGLDHCKAWLNKTKIYPHSLFSIGCENGTLWMKWNPREGKNPDALLLNGSKVIDPKWVDMALVGTGELKPNGSDLISFGKLSLLNYANVTTANVSVGSELRLNGGVLLADNCSQIFCNRAKIWMKPMLGKLPVLGINEIWNLTVPESIYISLMELNFTDPGIRDLDHVLVSGMSDCESWLSNAVLFPDSLFQLECGKDKQDKRAMIVKTKQNVPWPYPLPSPTPTPAPSKRGVPVMVIVVAVVGGLFVSAVLVVGIGALGEKLRRNRNANVELNSELIQSMMSQQYT
jgi:hypothetical protein